MKSTLIATITLALFFFGCIEENQSEHSIGSPDILQSALESDEEAPFGGRPCKGPHRKGHMGKLFFGGIINLSDAQKTQIREIIKDKRPNFLAMRKEMRTLSFEERKAKRKAHRDAMLEAILPVLTSEQKEKVESIHAKLEKGEVPEELIDARLKRMSERLKLSEEQQTQIKPILSEYLAKKFQARQTATSRDEMREAMSTLREEKNDKMAVILTDEQKELSRKKCRRNSKSGKGRKFGRGSYCNK